MRGRERTRFFDGIGLEVLALAGAFGGGAECDEENVGQCEDEKVPVKASWLGELGLVHSEAPIPVFEVPKHGFYPHAPCVSPNDSAWGFVHQVGHEKPRFLGLAILDAHQADRPPMLVAHCAFAVVARCVSASYPQFV